MPDGVDDPEHADRASQATLVSIMVRQSPGPHAARFAAGIVGLSLVRLAVRGLVEGGVDMVLRMFTMDA